MYSLKYELKAVDLGLRKLAIPSSAALPENYQEVLKSWGYYFELSYMLPLDVTTCLPPKGYLVEVRVGRDLDAFRRVSAEIDRILDEVYAASEESWDESLCVKYITKEALGPLAAYHRFRGEALGYPRCCVETYVDGFIDAVRAVLDGERIRAKRLLRLAAALELAQDREALEAASDPERAAESELPHVLYAFPYDNFYPHRLDCPKALAIGRELEYALPPAERKYYRLTLAARALFTFLQLWRSYSRSERKIAELQLLEEYAPRLLKWREWIKKVYPSANI